MNTQHTFDEQVAAAVEAGDRRRIDELYAEKARFGRCGGDREYLSAEIFEATLNAAKKDNKTLGMEVLNEILAVQTMLAHRVCAQLMAAIHQHDKDDRDFHNWGRLPGSVSDVLLPRYARISSAIFDTLKMQRRLDGMPAQSTDEEVNAGQG